MLYFVNSFISSHVTVDNCYYLLPLWKTKKYNIKWKTINFKKIRIMDCTCYYFDDIINLEDLTLDNILIDEKSFENIFNNDISYKTLIDPKPLSIRFDQKVGCFRIYDGNTYLTLFSSENMTIYIT